MGIGTWETSCAGPRRQALRRLAGVAGALSAPWVGVRAEPTIRIGLSLPLSGVPQRESALVSYLPPDLGLDFLAAFQAAVDLERHHLPISLVAMDDEFKPDRARTNLETLARQDVIAASGLWTTEQALAAQPVLEASGLPMVGLRSNAAELRSGRASLLFHLRPGLDDEVAALLATMKIAGHTRWGVVHADNAFGRAALKALQAQGAQVVRAVSTTAHEERAAAAAREAAHAPGVQAVLIFADGDVLAGAMAELRLRANAFLAPVCGLSNVLCTALASTRQPAYAGFAVTSPFANPLTSRAAIAVRFREAMLAKDLDHAVRSFSAFEGFVYGTVLTRAIVALGPRPTREALAAALRGRTLDLGGLPIAFDEHQVGIRRVNLLYKSSSDWLLRA